MENELTPQQANTTAQHSTRPSDTETQIMAALVLMATERDGKASREYLKAIAAQLSREPLDEVLQAIGTLGRTERRQGETALPSLGRILREIAEQNHPHRFLRESVRKMAALFQQEVTPELMAVWEDTFGHRTDEDIKAAYDQVIRESELRRMPTTGTFLSVMPTMRRRREEAQSAK